MEKELLERENNNLSTFLPFPSKRERTRPPPPFPACISTFLFVLLIFHFEKRQSFHLIGKVARPSFRGA